MQAKRKRGRPIKQEDLRRSVIRKMCVTPSDSDALDAWASLTGKSVSTMLYEIVTDLLGQVKLDQENRAT